MQHPGDYNLPHVLISFTPALCSLGNFIRDEMVTGGSGGLAGGTGEAGVAGKGGIVIVEWQQG